MMGLAAFLSLAACAALALSQDRNWQIVAAPSSATRPRVAMRWAGWVLLALAFALSLAAEGAGFGVLFWTLQAAVASFAVAMALSYSPGVLRPLARVFCALFSPDRLRQ